MKGLIINYYSFLHYRLLEVGIPLFIIGFIMIVVATVFFLLVYFEIRTTPYEVLELLLVSSCRLIVNVPVRCSGFF